MIHEVGNEMIDEWRSGREGLVTDSWVDGGLWLVGSRAALAYIVWGRVEVDDCMQCSAGDGQ